MPWSFLKDLDAGKDWGQEKRVKEDEIVEWRHQHNVHEFEQTPGHGEGQGREDWHAAVHGVTKSRTWLSDWRTTVIHYRGFPGGTVVKCSLANVGDTGSVPGSGRSPAGGNGSPLQYSCLKKIPWIKWAWQATIHGATKTWIQLSTTMNRSNNSLCWAFFHVLIFSPISSLVMHLSISFPHFKNLIIWVFSLGIFIMYYIHTNTLFGEGNGTPLQYSLLENPMDRRAW